ncbi:TetR/AcrR family transcriptional regulator [Rhodohalobacter sp.]|uniref:TetR/AcrR family transcriptional regulator n=1 Tax=Rhodohalobacter sp. TaxID=1974210 RepID=UPI002ACE1738|nr:TetR/AcrR family transcriptional regulator [Rhodohalobacter sp.]MDZ7756556.1 TetR/AcrR family transcriptional regulator [Rhodohalobacter sp.]
MSLREEILDVSKELLLKHGFSKISMRKIARKADVTATSIYLHFENKDDLLLALVEESIAKLNKVLRNALDEAASPIEQLKSLTDAYVDFALKNPQEYEIIYMVRPEEMPKYPKEKFQQVREIYELLAGIIKRGKERNLFDVEDPLVSAYTLWAQIHGVVSVVLGKRLDTRVPIERFLDLATDHIIQGFIIQKTPA